MRIAVTGAMGQVAQSLAERAGQERGRGATIVPLARPGFDLARPETIAPALAAAKADLVINAAAYTAVDKAESEEGEAFAVNALGAGELARAAHAARLPLIHLSTDYVFDGTKPSPYGEGDATGPTGAYGRTKLAGEQAVLAAHPGAVIARTAWVYSPFGANFVKTMLRLAETREEVGVVADQRGNPTSALDIADALLAMAARLVATPDQAPRGLFHLAGSGEGTWADLAEAVFEASTAAGGPSARVRRIATADYPTPARRPANSRLDCAALKVAYGIILPDWRQSVAAITARLIREKESTK